MSKEYDDYLREHCDNVRSAYEWINYRLPMITRDYGIVDFIDIHDISKFSSDEYDAYDAYFYGTKTPKVKEEFNKAWLHHIHENPHHWQHWVLINDDPEKGHVALPMNYVDIVEMICDWWSFSWKSGNLYEIFDWYEKHKSYMILHDDTRKIVEDILTKIRNELDYINKQRGE